MRVKIALRVFAVIKMFMLMEGGVFLFVFFLVTENKMLMLLDLYE